MLYYRTYVKDESLPWVTFVHGAGGSSAIWYKQMKAYKKYFNVLLVDLRGHGQSGRGTWEDGDHFSEVSREIIDVLDHLRIEKAHFVGISLGTIVIQTIAQEHPARVASMILGGAITELNWRTRFLIAIANATKYILPYMLLYRLFAWIIMPKKNHLESRHAFVRQAAKMCQKEFINWLSLTKSVNPYLEKLQSSISYIPTLFIMGQEDHLFIKSVKTIAQKAKTATFKVIKGAGHVCNIDEPDLFNQITIEFINRQKRRLAS
ncbi:alpha/beta hydrolase [Aeromicrobium ponti]|uniref:Pimeloyl-ACP methyl ester carboxylesterase n=1 Tax=Cytobacillus oceanisediminis TaxID=665099 RepID=A0A562JPB2_9BACI|nr:alpha/beta hydrolase [Cytobacillus oceanisediminis]TWH85010.1 pimeloyl-ACP methyl ester carboxylesterase [Cytobacillus oceanisediminis]